MPDRVEAALAEIGQRASRVKARAAGLGGFAGLVLGLATFVLFFEVVPVWPRTGFATVLLAAITFLPAITVCVAFANVVSKRLVAGRLDAWIAELARSNGVSVAELTDATTFWR